MNFFLGKLEKNIPAKTFPEYDIKTLKKCVGKN